MSRYSQSGPPCTFRYSGNGPSPGGVASQPCTTSPAGLRNSHSRYGRARRGRRRAPGPGSARRRRRGVRARAPPLETRIHTRPSGRTRAPWISPRGCSISVSVPRSEIEAVEAIPPAEAVGEEDRLARPATSRSAPRRPGRSSLEVRPLPRGRGSRSRAAAGPRARGAKSSRRSPGNRRPAERAHAEPGPSASSPTTAPVRGSSTSSRRWMLSPSCAASMHTSVSSADSPTWSNPSVCRSESENPIRSASPEDLLGRPAVLGDVDRETRRDRRSRRRRARAPSARPSGHPAGAPGNTSRGSPPSNGTASQRPDSSPVGSENQTTLEPSPEIVARARRRARRCAGPRPAPSSHAYAWNEPLLVGPEDEPFGRRRDPRRERSGRGAEPSLPERRVGHRRGP